MKLVTFNIRYDCGQDRENNFCHRKPLILEKIRQEAPDILCFQEVLPHMAMWLKENLKEFYVVGCPREAQLDGEQVCIAFRSSKWNLLQMDTYWLSPTPWVPGSRYDLQSICPRVCTEVLLQELASGKVVRIINTQLDHEGAPARLLAVQQILQKLNSERLFPQAPVILAGDLNAGPDSEEIQLLRTIMRNESADIGHTFHQFGQGENLQIDYIFTKGDVICRHVEKWTDCKNGIYLSDHYPVCAMLELQDCEP